MLGEGSGTVILEDYDHAKARHANILAEIVGYGTTSDAYHMTAPDPEGKGAIRAMQQALMKPASMKPKLITSMLMEPAPMLTTAPNLKLLNKSLPRMTMLKSAVPKG